MRSVAKRDPDDANVLVFFADALMNLQPWDYWESDGVTPKGHGREIAITLKEALEVDPDHPAAAHLFIHAVEASAHPGDAEAVADRLRGSVPAAGHLAHMPAHIYTRIGRYKDSMEVNRDAIAADEAFLAQADTQASALYRFGYYPHNVHFLMTSAQMAGVAEDVFATAEKLAAVTSDDVAQDLAWVQAIKSAPYSAHAQFSAPDTILALTDPGSRFPFVKGFWHYARGVALAARGEVAPAWQEVKAIEAIIAEADLSALEAQYLPARDVLGIAKHLVEARIEQSREDYAAAAHHAMEAVALQDGLPYMEPPYWYYPARQTLGAIQLQQGRAEAAVETFNKALAETPRNGWALWGLLQAQLAADQNPVATRAALQKAWLGWDDLLTLGRLYGRRPPPRGGRFGRPGAFRLPRLLTSGGDSGPGLIFDPGDSPRRSSGFPRRVRGARVGGLSIDPDRVPPAARFNSGDSNRRGSDRRTAGARLPVIERKILGDRVVINKHSLSLARLYGAYIKYSLSRGNFISNNYIPSF
jgi:tetratricopeptide (TPR) repeat protein